MEDLEATFTIDNTPTASSQIKSPAKKQSVTTLLDISRANNIGKYNFSSQKKSPNYLCFALAIMLSRIKLSYPEIRKALLDIDDQRLSIDDLIAISKQLPTSEEVREYMLCMVIMFIMIPRIRRSDESKTSKT